MSHKAGPGGNKQHVNAQQHKKRQLGSVEAPPAGLPAAKRQKQDANHQKAGNGPKQQQQQQGSAQLHVGKQQQQATKPNSSSSNPTKKQAAAGTEGNKQATKPASVDGSPPPKPATTEAGSSKASKAIANTGTGTNSKGGTGTSGTGAVQGGPPSSNWAALRAKIGATGEGAVKRRQIEKVAEADTKLRIEQLQAAGGRKGKAGGAAGTGKKPAPLSPVQGVTPLVAVDCEMVGVGPDGQRSALARVAVINAAGNVLLDVFVRPKEKVTDYRTQYSGVRPQDLRPEAGALALEEVQAKVAALLKGRTLVGHAITNDLTALLLDHPRKDIRDTAKYPPLMRTTALGRKPRPRALRHLAAEHLGLDIQTGEHSPVDDARAALYLYLKFRQEWEAAIKSGALKRGAQAIKVARKAAVTAAATALAAASAAQQGRQQQQQAAGEDAGAGDGSGAPPGRTAGASAHNSKALLAAARMSALATTGGGPHAGAASVPAPQSVLTGAQIRALRQGRGIKGQKTAADFEAGATGGAAAASGFAAIAESTREGGSSGGKKGRWQKKAPASQMAELAHLAAKQGAKVAQAAVAGGPVGAGVRKGGKSEASAKRMRSMAEVLARDVRLDPMADL